MHFLWLLMLPMLLPMMLPMLLPLLIPMLMRRCPYHSIRHRNNSCSCKSLMCTLCYECLLLQLVIVSTCCAHLLVQIALLQTFYVFLLLQLVVVSTCCARLLVQIALLQTSLPHSWLA